MSQKKEQFDDEWLDEFERDFVLRQIEAGRVKPQPSVLLEQQGWREWLMTLFPFWFSDEFSADQSAFWELRWSVLQRYKQQMREWDKFTDQEERTQYFIEKGIYVSPKESTAFEFWGRGIGKSATLEAARIMYGAILNSGYSLMISETDDQAQEHLGNCRILIEHPDSKLVQYYPEMAITDNSDAVRNMPTADRKEMLICKNGWILRAKGLSAKMRGLRVGTQRPSEICHEKGTRIYTEDRWMNVEDHPTARERIEDGVEVRVHGLPYPEVVTNEHRYWVRSLPLLARPHWERAVDGWMEAKDLHSRCYIGLPIDQTVIDPPAIKLNPIRTITKRNDKGQVVRGGCNGYVHDVPVEFHDLDWWWLIGLWWGDGYLYKVRGEWGGIAIIIADTTPHIYDKIKALRDRYGKKVTFAQKTPGCYTVHIGNKPIARWLANEWKKGNAMKLPPKWVEQMPIEYQKHLIRGYLDADGFVDKKQNQIRLTSVYLEGLLSVRRMLARIGIAASIRSGIDGKDDYEICGVRCKTRKKYDLRFKTGAHLLGYDGIGDASRYKFCRTFIADGHLWSKIRDITPVQDRVFVPIDTPTRDYLTAFGRSHNCLDDVDDVNDSLMVSLNKERVVTSSILPVLAKERLIIDFGQNLITDHSFATRLWNGKSDALSERTIFGVTNAFEKLDIDSFIDDTGKLRHTILPTSIPSWKGLNITAAQRFLNNSGLQTFLAEYQNEFDQFKSGKVIPEYDESVQIITWSDFERVFGERRIPAHWQSIVGLDVGYTEGNYPHYSAWVFMTAAAQNSRYPGLQFVYRSRFFKKVSIDDQAEQVKQDMWPGENVYSWQMSHEKTGEMMTLNKQHQLPFYKFKYYKSEDGVAQWRHLSRPDKRYPHPFLPDDQNEDGSYQLGRPLLYYIVDDDQRIHARNDAGMMLLRQQISEWDYVPVKLTDSGQTVQKPSKVNDDGVDALRAIICYFGAVPTELNQAERIQTRMPETLRTAESDEDKQARGYWLQREAKRIEREAEQQGSRGFGRLGAGLRNFEKMRRM